ncbi:hypothetical protein GF324_10430 [bacterium]|nr:hypothetical protein [bacterium]
MTQSSTMKRIGLFLEPLDTLFFRDGRPFTQAGNARGDLPQPQTLTGALTTHLLRQAGLEDFMQWRDAFQNAGGDMALALNECGLDEGYADIRYRGPWPASAPNGSPQPKVFLKAPVILMWDDKPEPEAMFRYAPMRPGELPPGWRLMEDERVPLWIRRQDLGKAVEGFVDLEGMETFLRGETPAKKNLHEASSLYGYDSRTGIGINAATHSVEEGLIYSVSMLAMKKGMGFYAEIDLPETLGSSTLFQDDTILHWGGEGRRVRVQPAEPVRWPAVAVDGSKRSAYVLTTPGRFSQGWQPDAPPQGASLLAASVPGHGAVSGWDLAKGGPKPTRFTVPAGSVYFFDNDTGANLETFSNTPDNLREGWGLVLRGVWDYA